MRRKATYHYFVEGEDEKSLLNVLKSDLGCIESGKVGKCHFDITKFWSRLPNNKFRPFGNDSEKIKIES